MMSEEFPIVVKADKASKQFDLYEQIDFLSSNCTNTPKLVILKGIGHCN